MDNVLVTPHLGASTREAQVLVATEAVELIINYLTHGEIRSAVNTAALDPKTLEELRAYMNAAWRLGIMLDRWHDTGIDQIDIEYCGSIAHMDNRVLTSALCAGLLKAATPRVNIVNALARARDRGISVNTSTCNAHNPLGNVVTCTVHGDGNSHKASVAVFGEDMPRLAGIGDYRTDACIDGTLMLFSHNDAPGVIGFVGTILAEDHVNISQMVVGRAAQPKSKVAMGVLNLDSAPTGEALSKVAEYPGIDSLKIIPLPASDELPEWLA